MPLPQTCNGRYNPRVLIVALERLLAEFKANTLIVVTFAADAQADQALTSDARLALVYIAQEALSNAAKQCRASRMEVQLVNETKAIVLSLTDNGRGFVPDQVEQRMGHGLVNMRDRARTLGSQLSVQLAAGGGTEVRVSIPKVQA